jgi:hypothetical protein
MSMLELLGQRLEQRAHQCRVLAELGPLAGRLLPIAAVPFTNNVRQVVGQEVDRLRVEGRQAHVVGKLHQKTSVFRRQLSAQGRLTNELEKRSTVIPFC